MFRKTYLFQKTEEEYIDTKSNEILKKITIYNGDFFRKEIKYFNNKGNFHRVDGPAAIYIYNNGSMSYEWMRNGKLHRKDGPALYQINKSGKEIKRFFKKGNEIAVIDGADDYHYLDR